MSRTRKTLLTIATLWSVGFFVLDLIQPWKSAYLYMPLRERTYLTVDNRTGAWWMRIGTVGGLDGFEMALTDTNQAIRHLRTKYRPFPVNWFADWYCAVQGSSPYLMMTVPAYFPAIACALWPVLWSIRRKGRRGHHESPPPGENSEAPTFSRRQH